VLAAKIPVAFLAGFVSIVTPCVLPLVPGYLSAVSAVDAGRLGERGSARRVVLGSVPFIVGFTVVFVAVGAAAAGVGRVVDAETREAIAGFVLVVLGLAFMGLLPVPARMALPGLLAGARRTGSGLLLGAAFAVCAAPCIGTVLASVVVLAGDASSAVRGGLVLLAYSAGLAAAFLAAGIAFTHAMGAFRWLRDHFRVIQIVSGAVLVVLGLLLFFDRDWWLRSGFQRLLEALGLA
jgi:cytochrome c-type biogenesis protein